MLNFLYGKHRKVLKVIRKYKTINRTDLCAKTKLEDREVYDICCSLHNDGYISYVGYSYNLKITPKGCDYFAFKKAYRHELFFKSIFCPIIVAFFTSLITSLITLWLKGLLG